MPLTPHTKAGEFYIENVLRGKAADKRVPRELSIEADLLAKPTSSAL
jgi:hypothetical protein